MTDFEKGQTVTFTDTVDAYRASGWGAQHRFTARHTAEVTAVRKNTLTVKWNDHSYNVPRTSLATPNGEAWDEKAKPKVRPIGEVPEGSISPDDPRLAYLWEDAARVAKNYGYCSVYDEITGKLGIPGRVRNITVSFQHNGVTVSSTVKARSEAEAAAIIKEKLGLTA